ncbi:MAG: VCBS repeat-containing protein [Candidatus Lambdaproteobacteria bacterium]|nr:VCBS repeat-containing protein [Candidatus Lambdaproteobacteria bacterium]
MPAPFRHIAVLCATALLSATVAAPILHAQRGEGVSHLWKRQYYGYLDGQLRMLFGPGFERGKPELADLDNDRDADLVMGGADGRLLYFENQGAPGRPDWRLVSEAISAETPDGSGAREVIDVGDNAAPALVDIDGDGDLDLFVGNAVGKLAFYRNVGNNYLPTFRLENTDYLARVFGLNLVVKFADVNGDGVPDMTLGNEDGAVFLVHNGGTRVEPKFCLDDPPPLDCLSPPVKLAQISPEDNAVPEWVDWDGDGDLDLMVGKSDGRIAYYRNIGTAREGSWELRDPRFNILDAGGYAAPLFRDIDGDGTPDLLLTGGSQRVAFYSTRVNGRQRDLWLERENVLLASSLGRFQTRLRVTSGDVTGNGLPDLFIGTRGGALLFYENVGGRELPAFTSHPASILPTSQRSFSTPAVADVDGDGLPDLVVGGGAGRLELIRNRGTRSVPKWEVGNLFLSGIDVGAMSAPVFRDLDGDGDPDLVVGNSLGNLVLYENRGDKASMDLVLRTTGLFRARVPGAAVPDFFPWDPKAPPDLVVGGQNGNLYPAARNAAVPVMQGGAYESLGVPWAGITGSGQALPHFVDLSGDGRPDLLLGGADGTLRYWEYVGNAPTSQVAMAQAQRRRENVLAGAEAGEGAAAGQATLRPSYVEPVFELEATTLNTLFRERNTNPALVDLTGDGLPELVLGTARGRVLVFRNRGATASPQWALEPEPLVPDTGLNNAAPTVADVDGDGDADLLIGTADGRVVLFLNEGSAQRPKFVARPDALRSVRGDKNAVPLALDLDGDGRLDLLVGNLKGWIYHYVQTRGPGIDFALEQRRFIGLSVGVSASPSGGDLTLNKQPVLLVGSDQGPVTVLERTTTSPFRSSGWKINRRFMEGLKLPPGSHPALGDVDGDGDLDLFVGSDGGDIQFYRNNALSAEAMAAGPPPGRTR